MMTYADRERLVMSKLIEEHKRMYEAGEIEDYKIAPLGHGRFSITVVRRYDLNPLDVPGG